MRLPNKDAPSVHIDANLPAPLCAMLLTDSYEGALSHAWRLIGCQLSDEAVMPDDAHSYVHITRFNLTLAVSAELAGFVPPEPL